MVGLTDEVITTLAISGINIFVGTLSVGIYLSTNNGNSWTAVNNGLTDFRINTIAVSGTNIFAGTQFGGVFLSTNNGNSWTAVNNGLTGLYINVLAISGTNVFAGIMSGGVFLSTNNGTSWTPVNNGLPSQGVHSFAASGTNIFAATLEGGVFLSTNNGASWINRNQGFNVTPPVYPLLIANNYIFAGTLGQSVWRRLYSEAIRIQNISTEIPVKYSIFQNYPNPFNPTTKIKFNIAKLGNVKIVVYDVMGREVQTLVNETLKPGTYETTFTASQISSGVYFYKISAGDFSETKKMLIVK